MTVSSNVASGDGSNSSGVTENEPKNTVVPRETYEKVLKEKKNRDAELQAAKERLAAFEAQEAAKAEEEARKRGDYETTVKTLKEQILARDKQLSEISEKEVRRNKVAAFVKAFGAPFPEKYGSLVDIDKIELDSDGKVDMQSAISLVDSFKKEYAEIIPKKVSVPTPNPQGSASTGKITAEEWLKLPYKEQQKRLGDVVKSTTK